MANAVKKSGFMVIFGPIGQPHFRHNFLMNGLSVSRNGKFDDWVYDRENSSKMKPFTSFNFAALATTAATARLRTRSTLTDAIVANGVHETSRWTTFGTW